MIARAAGPDDADELVRLRAVMLTSMPRHGWSDEWREPAREILVKRLALATPSGAGPAGAAPVEESPAGESPVMVAFVVDRPDGSGLASCALGTVEQRLGGPGDPSGLAGYVFSVATDPDMRRRGYSRACVTALLDWFRSAGIRKVDLRASADGEHLYESLGFRRTPDPAMRLRF